jgi:hypothetical protein
MHTCPYTGAAAQHEDGESGNVDWMIRSRFGHGIPAD